VNQVRVVIPVVSDEGAEPLVHVAVDLRSVAGQVEDAEKAEVVVIGQPVRTA
jgi:hypothetical protein